ncbi:MAG: SDR family NAD(P)-dependent oxidoreductase [Spirochaetales bacterium]|nr:SDR family NAD(P)-dependent oxidoreductase [Spirochaetales bacterium]
MKKTALITGAATRLGKELALALADREYDVIIHYNRSTEEAQQTAAKAEAKGSQAFLLQKDLTADVSGLVSQAQELCSGSLALLINSASCYESGQIRDTTVDQFDRIFQTNLRAPFFLAQEFRAEAGSGQIINILDNKIHFAQFAYSAYALSKKALADLTLLAAREFAPDIRVNGIAPGVILPQKNRSQEYLTWRLDNIPLKRKGHVADIIHALDFLLRSDFLTGQIITVDGGESIQPAGRDFTGYGSE